MTNSYSQTGGLVVEGGIARVETLEQFQAAMNTPGLTEIQLYFANGLGSVLTIVEQPLSGASLSVYSGQIHTSGLVEIGNVYGGIVHATEATIIHSIVDGIVYASDGVQILSMSNGQVYASGVTRISGVQAGRIEAEGDVKVWVDREVDEHGSYDYVLIGDLLRITGPQEQPLPERVAVSDSRGHVRGPEA